MGKLRSGVLVCALVLSGCGGGPTPVVTYPNGPAPQYQAPAPSQPTYQAPSITQQAPPQQAARTAAGPFSARFIDRGTGAPIKGLEVTIADTGQKATTDADGKVSFANVPAGAQYQTYHNDYVQAKEAVPSGSGIDIPLTAMADYK
jgi:hypothetical protein